MAKAVIFDMDGVLIDSEGIYLERVWQFAKSKNPEVQLSDLYGMVGSTKKDTWSVFAKAVDNGQSWEEFQTEYQQVERFDNIDYCQIFRHEALDLLKILQTKGLLIALASSTQRDVIEKVLIDNHIKHFFKVIVSGDQFVRSKPDPEIYHHTARQLGVAEEMCLVIEDSTVGITAARSAGMQVAALIDERYQFDQSQADIKLSRLSDIVNYL